MSFQVSQGSPMAIWVPIFYGNTIYTGRHVALDENDADGHDGVMILPVAAGAFNVTNYDIPLGISIGTNNRKPLFNSTAKAEYITSATPFGSTSEFVLTGGPYISGGREPMVKIDVIDPLTVIKGPLWSTSIGTGPTVVTCAADAQGDGTTSSAAQVATIQGKSTIYFRSGANKGSYRVLDSAASTTAHTWNIPLHAAVAATDTAVIANILPFGLSRVQTMATYGGGFDLVQACTSHYFGIDVLRLDLSTANQEWVEFRWNPHNWLQASGRD